MPGSSPASGRRHASRSASPRKMGYPRTSFATTGRGSTWLTRVSFSGPSSACTPRPNSPEPVSDWPSFNASFASTAEESGPRATSVVEPRSFLLSGEARTYEGQDHPARRRQSGRRGADDSRAQEEQHKNDVIVAHDGAEALDYLFGLHAYEGRDT